MGTLLIVIDMQNDFITGALGTKEAQKIVPKVVNMIKNHKGPIILTKDTHYSDYLTTLEGTKLPVEHCIKGTYGWELDRRIKEAADPNPCKVVLEKKAFGSVYRLAEAVRHAINHTRSDTEIRIVGLCTDICVVSNAIILRSALPNTKICVMKDCCAGTTKEMHEMALNVMKQCQIDVE